ncbi:MAG TPA: alanine dehydrogenase [Cryomorphaceae bacterium]|jgi:alanine dehydrogenase|nr:alanine dehydrogenase [Cryomorphaceae bacterium]|tara:strand:- start:23235 stop:24443 length:1209 start_codon:yes stop_codon:yes gene_type:complete
MSEYISWSETAWETQEERLAVDAKSAQLQIGLPKEHAMNEHRLLLTPESVQILVAQGHEIVVETGAGTLAGFSDASYANAGATIALGPEEVFQCAIVAKVAPPTVAEIAMMRGGQTMISALQLRTRNRDYFKSLADKKITALALEEVRNSEDQSALRMAMSEIAGQMAARVGASLLADGAHGSRKGKLMGPIPGVSPARVVVLGAGVAGLSAVRAAHGMGSQVVLMDSNINRLRAAQELNPALITEVIQELVVVKRLKKADLVIGALHPVNGRTPVVVSEDAIAAMEPNSVIIDISIDSGGCFESSELTSHENPTYEKHGVIHYCIPNMASAVGHTATIALSNFVAPMLSTLSGLGGVEDCLHYDLNMRAGLYLYKGLLTKRHLGEHFDLPFSNDALLFGNL